MLWKRRDQKWQEYYIGQVDTSDDEDGMPWKIPYFKAEIYIYVEQLGVHLLTQSLKYFLPYVHRLCGIALTELKHTEW